MKIAMIAAMAHNRVIGCDNKMPWHLPADLRFFKKVTTGKPVVMGRNTFESIGRPLPNRTNIVVTSNADYSPDGVIVVTNLDAALQVASEHMGESDEVMVIGGGKVYEALLSKTDVLYLTHIDLNVDGDTYFPDYNSQGNWHQSDKQVFKADEKNPYDYTFVTLKRSA